MLCNGLIPGRWNRFPYGSQKVSMETMNRTAAIIMILCVAILVCFGTWQLFRGNLEAAFSTLPFLLIIYFFIRPSRH